MAKKKVITESEIQDLKIQYGQIKQIIKSYFVLKNKTIPLTSEEYCLKLRLEEELQQISHK